MVISRFYLDFTKGEPERDDKTILKEAHISRVTHVRIGR